MQTTAKLAARDGHRAGAPGGEDIHLGAGTGRLIVPPDFVGHGQGADVPAL